MIYQAKLPSIRSYNNGTEIGQMKNSNQSVYFPIISAISSILMVIPAASATVEKASSVVRSMKT